jgi:hypothetical protein
MTEPLRIYRRSELEAVKPAIDSEGCLYRYKKLWIDGVPDDSDISLVGIGFHAVSHAYIEKLVASGIAQDFEYSQEAFTQGIANAGTPSLLVPMVSDLWRWHAESFELKTERFVAAEERGHSGNVGFSPDLVYAHPETNSLEIIDWKTGWHPPLSEAELKLNFQARVYSRYAHDRWPNFDKYTFTLSAVRFRKFVSVSFTPQELETVELEVQSAIQTILEAQRTDHWPAIAGPSCHFCSLSCPLADQDISVPKRFSVEQYQKVGEWLLVAEKQLRAVKKAMKAACAVHGPCNVNGVVFDNRLQVSKSYPMDAVLDVLKVRGVMGAFEGSTGLTFSQSALAKLFKAYPMLETDLSDVVQTKTSYKFSAKQAGVEDEDE